MIHCGICDDEKEVREQLHTMVKKFAKERQIPIKIWEYESGEELLEKQEDLHLLLLDIDMDGKNGLDVGQEIWKKDKEIKIIFISNLNGILQKSTAQNKVHSFAYLDKPICEEELYEQLEEVLPQLKKQDKKHMLHFQGVEKEMISLAAENIYYFEYVARKIKVIYQKDNALHTCFVKDSINHIAEVTKEYGFLLSHKAYVVNISYIKRINKYMVYMNGMETEGIPLSQKRAVEFTREWHNFRRRAILGE